ncbi:MAG: enoyl-CoA hydratase [Dehalococcoidia bacterium]|nr:enoyl-CoA hydratase [Dehalococcoidia bacterium]
MNLKNVIFENKSGVAYITINRPGAANTMDYTTAQELMQVALACDENPSVRAAVLTGAGSVFSAGGDLKSFAAQGAALPTHLKEVTTYLHAAISRLVRMRAPLIASVNGVAAGAGMALMMAADLAVAGESARFVMAYTRVGLTPDGSSTYFLPRLVGLRRALELSLTNRLLNAQEALQWGIINRIVPDAALADETEKLARELAAGPTLAFGATKELLHRSWTESLETQMELEARSIAAISRTDDTNEGIAAFIAKRPGIFSAR